MCGCIHWGRTACAFVRKMKEVSWKNNQYETSGSVVLLILKQATSLTCLLSVQQAEALVCIAKIGKLSRLFPRSSLELGLILYCC